MIESIILSADHSCSSLFDSMKSMILQILDKEDLKDPIKEEYEFFSMVSLPSPSSRVSQQQMKFTIDKKECRIRERISFDTTFL